MYLVKRGYSKKVKKINKLPRLGKRPLQPYGKAPYTTQKLTQHKRLMQVTASKIRKKQYPKESKKQRTSYGTEVFTVEGKTKTFEYLPHVPAKRHLGHPISLGDDIIVEINFKPTKALANMFEAWLIKRNKPRKGNIMDQLKRQVRWISAYYFKIAIEKEIRPKIHDIVPKASGRLQRGMIATVNRCLRKITKLPHILKLNTLDSLSHPIYYANPVNNMPTEWLVHPGTHIDRTSHEGISGVYRIYYHKSGPKLYHLNDPNAETDWYSKVIESAQAWFRANLQPLWKACVSLFGINLFSMAMYKHLKANMKFK